MIRNILRTLALAAFIVGALTLWGAPAVAPARRRASTALNVLLGNPTAYRLAIATGTASGTVGPSPRFKRGRGHMLIQECDFAIGLGFPGRKSPLITLDPDQPTCGHIDPDEGACILPLGHPETEDHWHSMFGEPKP